MMPDKRLMACVPHALAFIIKQVWMKWLELLANIALMFIFVINIERALKQELVMDHMLISIFLCIAMIVFRMIVIRRGSTYSYLASCDVKDTLRTQLFEKLQELGNERSDRVTTSELVQLSVDGIDQLEIYFGRYLPQFFYSTLAPLTLFLLLVWIDWRSALVLLICVPLIPISIAAVQTFAKKLLSKYWTSYAQLGDSFLENLQGLTTLKIYQADAYKHERMNEEAQVFRRITMKVLSMQLNSIIVMDIVAYGGAAAGSIMAILSYQSGRISLAQVLLIILLSAEFFIPLRQLGSFFHVAMNGVAASDKIFKVLNMEKKYIGKEVLQDSDIIIEVNHLNFSYDGKRQVLNDINMQMRPGSFIGIAGESGSGKSTCARLLMGLEKGYQGELLFQGKQRFDLNDEAFWKRVAYITHRGFVLKGSVRDNLNMAGDNMSDECMIDALKKVRLWDFLQEEQGLDTMILEHGSNLSGGQKQRLCIARALLSNRDIYVFDEATSNIDAESEAMILDVIKEVASYKSVIMITHRLASFADCEHIYVLRKGELCEQGNHQELLKQKGYYAELYEKQQVLEQVRGGEVYAA